MRVECRRVHKPGYTLRRLFFPLFIEEQDGRQPEHVKLLQQSLILRAVGGNVRLEQNGIAQRMLYLRIAEGVFSNSLQATHQSA